MCYNMYEILYWGEGVEIVNSAVKMPQNIEGIIKEEIISTYDVSARNEQEDIER